MDRTFSKPSAPKLLPYHRPIVQLETRTTDQRSSHQRTRSPPNNESGAQPISGHRTNEQQYRVGVTLSRKPEVVRQPSLTDNMGIILDRPKYPKYATLESRLKSFRTWLKENKQSPDRLAEAGFVYTGTDDAVRCYHCGAGLRHWSQNACPWREHASNYMYCGHVRQCLGDTVVTQMHDVACTKDAAADHSGSYYKCLAFSILDTDDAISKAMERNSSAVEAVQEFVEDEKLIRDAVNELTSSYDDRKFSATELMLAVEKIERSEKDRNSDFSRKHIQDSNNSSSNEHETREAIEEQNRELKSTLQCKICLDAFACIITLPCGHMVTCPQCISALSSCAMCRTPIKGTVRAFLSLG